MSTNEKELKENISSSDSLGLGSIEWPKYSCALGGAYGTALAVYGLVPLLHSGLGHLFGQLYAGGPVGGTSTPTTGLVEEHVIFGGEDKLRKLIQASTEVMEGEGFVVISGRVHVLI